MTCFLSDINSYLQLCRLLEDFYKYSGLRINNDKTELFTIGSIKLAQHDFIHNVRTSIKTLGTFFDHHKPSRNKANFESIFKSIQRTLNMWKWRGLTLLGKIQIVKTFIIPKFLSKAALISVSNYLIKEIYKLIRRSALINDIDNGGLKMLDTESMISAQRVMALKKYFADGNSSWKTILDEFLCNVGGKFILFCNFDTCKLRAYIPAFYKECLGAFSELKNSNVISYEDVINQIIWNNKNIVVDKQSLFEKHLFCQGIVKIGYLLFNTGKFLQSWKVLTANSSPTQYFKPIGVVDAIPIAWRLIIKQSPTSQHFSSSLLGDKLYIELDETEIDLSKVTSKLLYNKFKTKNQTPPSAQSEMKDKYPKLVVEWKKFILYRLPSQ